MPFRDLKGQEEEVDRLRALAEELMRPLHDGKQRLEEEEGFRLLLLRDAATQLCARAGVDRPAINLGSALPLDMWVADMRARTLRGSRHLTTFGTRLADTGEWAEKYIAVGVLSLRALYLPYAEVRGVLFSCTEAPATPLAVEFLKLSYDTHLRIDNLFEPLLRQYALCRFLLDAFDSLCVSLDRWLGSDTLVQDAYSLEYRPVFDYTEAVYNGMHDEVASTLTQLQVPDDVLAETSDLIRSHPPVDPLQFEQMSREAEEGARLALSDLVKTYIRHGTGIRGYVTGHAKHAWKEWYIYLHEKEALIDGTMRPEDVEAAWRKTRDTRIGY